MDETTAIFFDPNFNAVNYLNSIFKKINKTELNKLITVSNNLIIHLNFLVNQLNEEILKNLKDLSLANTNSRVEYFLKSLKNSIISLNNELDLPKFNQLKIINTLISFKTIKSKILDVLKIFKVLLTFCDKGEIKVTNFEKQILSYYHLIMEINDVNDKLMSLQEFIELSDVFKNLNNFNNVYKKNVGRFVQEKDKLDT